MSKLLKIVTFCLLIAVAFFACDALAQNNPFVKAREVLGTTFTNVRTIIMICGGFAVLVLGFLALLGKIKWGLVVAIAVGLGFVAMAGSIVSYFQGGAGEVTDTSLPEDIW